MTMEQPASEIISDEEVLKTLKIMLEEKEKKLKKSDQNDDPSLQADGEDMDEAGEEKDIQQALGNEFRKGEDEIRGAIKWIEAHGDACAYPDCQNKVESRRRAADPASITCTDRDHMDAEDDLMREIIMGLLK